jgi:ABC-type microcin C transport system permease subunit YejB
MNQTMIPPELVAPIFNPATFSNRRHVEGLFATLRRDYPVLQFGVLVVASAVVIVNILIDCTYAALDPRVRLSGGAA